MRERAVELGVDYVEVLERHSFDPGIWHALRALIRERRIDIVHAHEHKTDLLALLLARAERVIPLATAHGWSGLTAKERVYYFFDRHLLARYPVVVTVSEPIRRALVAHGARPADTRRIPNGIDHHHFKRDEASRRRMRAALGIDDSTVVIGGVGRLEQVKRFDLLMSAMTRLPAQPRTLLVLAGDGSCRPALEAHRDALGLGDRVRMLGHRDDALDIHQALDVYAQSSDSEGIPNVVLEAMAVETPVVATDVGGTREIIDDGVHGLLVPAADPGALARAITETIVNRDATATRVRAARGRIELELSFDSRNRALEAIYVELMRRFASRRQAVALA
jgi:glycosyltransferase involved in cell wall biosynthesis